MLYNNIFLVLFLVLQSCKTVNLESEKYQMRITTTLLTPIHQEEYSIIKNELEKLFFTSEKVTRQCNISIVIQKTIQQSGLTSTAFSINQTLNFTVKYHLTCNDNMETSGNVTLTNDLTLLQDKTVGQYVGQNHIAHETSKQAASMIYNQIKIFSILNNKKLDK